jgi:MFS family permease
MALHLASNQTLIVTLCVSISNFIWLPLMGSVAHRVGRTPLLITFTALALVTACSAMLWLVHRPSFLKLLTVELWLSFLYGSYNAAMVVYLTEMMQPDVRASGFSLAYSLATAIFGGFTPLIATYFIDLTKNQAFPGIILSIAAAVGLAAALITRVLRKIAETA